MPFNNTNQFVNKNILMFINSSTSGYVGANGVIEIPNGLNSSEYAELLNYYLEGIREQIQSKPSSGKINYVNNLGLDYSLKEAYLDAYKEGRLDATKFDTYKLFNVNYNSNLRKLFDLNNLLNFPTGIYNASEYFDSVIGFYKEGFKEQKNGISGNGKINWIFNNVSDKRKWLDAIEWYLIGRENATRMSASILNDVVKNPSLRLLSDKKYFNGKDYNSQVYFESLNYYKKGVEEQVAGTSQLGAINWINANVSNPELATIFTTWYKKGYDDSKSGLPTSETNNINLAYLIDKLNNQVATEKRFSKYNIISQKALPSSLLLPTIDSKMQDKNEPSEIQDKDSVVSSNVSLPSGFKYKPLIIGGVVIVGLVGLIVLAKKLSK